MKYTLSYIFENRYDPIRGHVRKMQERFIPLNFILKFLSPYPTYAFLNLRVSPDTVTFFGIILVIGSAALFFLGKPFAATALMFGFILFDSVDGDMARCSRRKTVYGGTLDSLGADFFYTLIPFSLGYFLHARGISIYELSPDYTMFTGAFVSLTFLLYRLVNAKMIGVLASCDVDTRNFSTLPRFEGGAYPLWQSLARFLIKIYRHELVKGNFFSEPGMILWFAIGVATHAYSALAFYLVLIGVYNTGYLIMNVIRAYSAFTYIDKQKIHE